jgi:hypothetical protein
MDQKQWEQRLDRAADKVSKVVGDGVHVLEDAYAKGKETLQDEFEARRGPGSTGPGGAAPEAPPGSAEAPRATHRGSRKLGLMLVGLGIVWLLHTLRILDQPVFPALLIALGIYFVARSK